jgi:extracellular elastinolytic metalloproteinase
MLRSTLAGVVLLAAAASPAQAAPRMLVSPGGALTKPSGESRTVIARDFLGAHGFSSSDLGSPQVQQTPGGVTIVSYAPTFRGVHTFDGARVVLDRSGEVVESLGSPPPAAVASATPKLSAAESVEAAERRFGGPTPATEPTLTFYENRLGWDFTYGDDHVVVDASDGALLYRASLLKSANDATVYPLAPGASPAQAVTFPAGWLAADATTLDGPHAHAYSDADGDHAVDPGEEVGRTAAGDFNYPLHDFSAQVEDRRGPAGCGRVLCTWDSSVPGSWRMNRQADTVQAFYLANTFHDHLAEPDTVAFLPPFAFEKANGDALELEADEGAATGANDLPDFLHLNNASMDTHPQGQPPRMQMILFEDEFQGFQPYAEINGGDDALVLWHEYTHGLTSRLITTADGQEALDSGQASAMSEGWSDWYALDFADRQGLMVDDADVIGDMDAGADVDSTSALNPGGHLARTQGIDCPVGAGSPSPTTRCPGGLATGAGGYTFGDYGKVGQYGPEPHSDGEIWSETLWDVRRALIEHTGSDAEGSRLAEQLITEGLRLTPPEPTFLEARDAILAADRALQLGLQDTLWQVFARRGMGFYAGTSSVDDVEPLEDFNTPPPASAPNGTLTGTVTDSQTGAGIAGVAIALGPLTTKTDGSGRYSLSVAQGRYPRLRFTAAGYDENASTPFTVAPDATAVKDIELVRNWSAASGGATISDQSADAEAAGGPPCGPAAMLAQDDRHGWVMLRTDAVPPLDPPVSAPFAVVELPQAVDVAHIGIDPTPRCQFGDPSDQSAALGSYRLEVSADGRTFRPFERDGRGVFGPSDLHRLDLVAPDGDNGRNVRFIRIDPLEPQDSTCSFPCEAALDDNVGQLEVFGVAAGSQPATAPPANTPAAAPPAPAPDTRPAPAPAKPTAQIPARGRGGKIAIPVTCASSCTVSVKLVASAATAKRDKLRRRTLASVKKTVHAKATLTLELTPAAVRALKRAHRASISGVLTVKISGGTSAKRTVKLSR